METATPDIKRAVDHNALAPLVELCKAGHLFEVQEWIAAGQPVNPPPIPPKGNLAKSPLEISIERGFHSLVQVLLEGGAAQEPIGYDSPMNRALRARRFDIVQLLVENGFDPHTVDMREVFASWDPQIMAYFIERGGELHHGRPFADAFCNRIRTALRFFKECVGRNPELKEQANIALRHHCKEGNLKWVSLMLWAGADPHKPGTEYPNEELEEGDEGLSALGFAALYDHFEIFELKPIRTREAQPNAAQILSYLTKDEGLDVLKRLLAKGVNPNDQTNGGCSTIQSCLNQFGWARHFSSRSWDRDSHGGLDTRETRDRLKAIHLLAKHGARWVPEQKDDMSTARRSLLCLTPDYTVEFVWLMSKYRACELSSVQELLRTPSIKAHMKLHRARLDELLATWT